MAEIDAQDWEVVFNLTGIKEKPGEHFFGMYNRYTGVLRIFYYLTKDRVPSHDGNDHMWSLGLSKDLIEHVTFQFALPYGEEAPDSYKTALGGNDAVFKTTALTAADPAVLEDLEDNYYYGAIVDISDHGCGSGKFVVFREYQPADDSPGMAVRLDGHHWETWELNQKDNAARVYGRASSLNTLQQAGEIYRRDQDILYKQLKTAGYTSMNQHYASSTTTWNGWHNYYCLHDGECDWIGPVNDTDFFECWIYWFKPQGSSIYFW